MTREGGQERRPTVCWANYLHLRDHILPGEDVRLREVNDVDVTVTFDPPWKPEMMSDEARTKLGFDPTPVPKNEPKIETEWE